MIQDIIELLNDQQVKFETPLFVVESGFTAASEPSIHSPYNTLHALMVQFSGGLKPERVLYIGHSESKARAVHGAYFHAYMKSKEIMEWKTV